MTTHPMNPVRSEQGVALIIVLLLLAVMAGLTTGLTLNGQTEITMAHNETYYAGARAAAEAGMNRAVEQIVANTAINLLDDPNIPVIGNGPFVLNDQYSYRYEILDDDDPSLYVVPLTDAQLLAMGGGDPDQAEEADANVNHNKRMLVRCIGMGPRGTSVTVTRVLTSTEIPDLPEIRTIVTNPAILVNGNLDIAGNTRILGLRGNVHANGDITGGGSLDISGDVTATGTVEDDIEADGMVSGGMPPITVPEIRAQDFINLADYKLKATGGLPQIRVPAFPANTPAGWTDCVPKAALDLGGCPTGWTAPAAAGAAWSASGSMPDTGTYYVEGPVDMSGTAASKGFTKLSLIAEGSIKITGNGKFKPENDQKLQFVTNGDFELGGTADADDPIDMDGQIMVREQVKIYGNSEFQGRVMVQDVDGASNMCPAAPAAPPAGCRMGTSTLTENSLNGNMTVTYNGGLGDITTTLEIPPGPPSYTNNISGWIEQ